MTTAARRVDSDVAAADPARSVWVAANAGTGKTHLLINRVTRLLMAGTPPAKILCLTFTRAAAAEMTNRLNERLGAWSTAQESALREDLATLTGGAVTDAMVGNARRLFAETTETPGGLKIQTIHAFCESLLGRFPLEAGIAPHFAVMDERTAAELMAHARDRVLTQAFEPAGDGDQVDNLAGVLGHVAGLVDEQGFADIMAELAFVRARLAPITDAAGGGEAGIRRMVKAARQALGLGPDETPESVLADGTRRGAYDQAGLKRAADALGRGSASDKDRGTAIAHWLAADDAARAAAFESAYAPVFLTKEDEPRKESGLITKKAQAADESALDALLAEQARVAGVVERMRAAVVAQATEAALRIGVALLQAYRDAKERRALLDYDDLIQSARSLLKGRRATQWVLYKLDGGIDHILLDEAQDTSLDQWRIVEALCDEFFSGEGARQTPRTLFVVGDEKQSIYSFQGADPDAFQTMRDHFATQVRDAAETWSPVDLELSRRSVPVVLEVIDAVFGQGPAANGVTASDAPIHHPPFRAGQAGLVELWSTLTPDEEPDTDPWDAPLDQLAAASPESRLAGRIAETIGGWLDGGEILASQDRPIEPDDIMILVRTRTRFFAEMVRALKARGVPVAGTDRMVLTDQLAVMDLVALGNAVLLPEDDLTLATVLKGPLIGFDEETLYDLAHGRDGTLWRALEVRRGDGGAFARAHATLARLRQRADFTPPHEFFADLLGADGGRRAIIGRLGRDADDPLDEFLALALRFEQTHPPSLQGFLHWVEAGGTEIKRDLEQGRGEVRVMTVHGAKGLQARVVFLPDTCTVPATSHGNKLLWRTVGAEPPQEPMVLWPVRRANEGALCRQLRDDVQRRHAAEYRRLLYVAMTRARDRLYVCGYENKRGRAEGCWYDLIEGPLKERATKTATPGGETVWRLVAEQTAPPEDAGREAPEGAPPALPDWARRAPPPEPEPARPLVPSRADGEAPSVRSPLAEDGPDPYQRGRLIHRLLQSLPELPAEARAPAAAAFLARPVHRLEADARAEIAAEVAAVLDDPDLAPVFGPGSRAEVALTGAIGNRVIAGQVDRLLIADDAVTVIDYKTNRAPPEDEAEVAEIYLRQMAAYRAVLARIYPDRPVRCVLLWTDGPRAMALSAPLLDRHAP